ncbi:hypothetical protein ACFZDK_25875 [Streptomyces sp. NPDC007901]|uniref:hypothetical protein n=1 Tax=Streptomyces sp. NPDC007901 TaxID=3364785 RepID=UPI0036EBFB74
MRGADLNMIERPYDGCGKCACSAYDGLVAPPGARRAVTRDVFTHPAAGTYGTPRDASAGA